MNKFTVRLLAAVALAAVIALPASAASVVNVYVGYLNNIGGSPNPADIPTPFDPSLTTTLISSGDSTTSHDTGVIRFENLSSVSVTIGPFVMAFANNIQYQPWGLLAPFVLAAGQNLVLAETANFNFDTSDFPGVDKPMVFGAVNGSAFGFTDEHRVLYGHEEAAGPLETTPYSLIGSIQVPVPVPGVALLFGSALAGFAAIGRRRAA